MSSIKAPLDEQRRVHIGPRLTSDCPSADNFPVDSNREDGGDGNLSVASLTVSDHGDGTVTGTQSASLKNAPISYYTRYLRAPSARVHPFRRILTACCCIAKIFRYLMFGDSADPGSSDHMQLLTQEKRALHAYLKSYEK